MNDTLEAREKYQFVPNKLLNVLCFKGTELNDFILFSIKLNLDKSRLCDREIIKSPGLLM